MFLALGLSGLFLAGPGRLLIPLNVLTFWGAAAWVLWTAFYLIVAWTIIQKLHRRIVVYNFSAADLTPKLWEVVCNLDDSAAWVGNSMALPKYGVQFYIEAASISRNVTLVATGPAQSIAGWLQLEMEIVRSFRTISVASGRVAWFFLFATIGLIVLAASVPGAITPLEP